MIMIVGTLEMMISPGDFFSFSKKFFFCIVREQKGVGWGDKRAKNGPK